AGLVNGDGPAALGGSLTFGTPATRTSAAGSYLIVPGGLTSGNYRIRFVPGILTVTPLPLPRPVDQTTGAATPTTAPDGQATDRTALRESDRLTRVVTRDVYTPVAGPEKHAQNAPVLSSATVFLVALRVPFARTASGGGGAVHRSSLPSNSRS